jgi:uncharacterized protein
MEANTIPQRPLKVTLAVNLLYVSLVIWAIQCFLYWAPVGNSAGLPGWGTLPMILKALAFLGVDFGLYYMIGKGRNWARMVFLVLSGMGPIIVIPIFFIFVFTEIPVPPLDASDFIIPAPFSVTLLSLVSTIVDISGAGLQIAALILLFQRDSSDWFRAMKALRKPQEVPKRMSRESEPGEPLIAAARKGDMKQIQDLLGKGADVNAQNKWGLTPLMAAAHGGHIVAGKLLLEKGADINAMQHGGWTALMVAAVKGHVDVVNLLLGKGADVNARTESRMTALILARSNGRSQVVQLLKAHEA